MMESLSPYIPIDRRLALLTGVPLPEHSEGAALFADISGFTPLTEALLEELGPKRGPEELTRQLNDVYNALITQVHSYGGSVISFSGDAITCWLNADTGLRATTCALVMQETMEQFKTITTPSGNIISLGMKVAVATGPVRRFQVGDPNIQYLDVLAGSTLERMASAEGWANKGDVVITAETATHLGANAHILEWRGEADSTDKFAVITGVTNRAETKPWPDLPSLDDVGGDDVVETLLEPWLLPPIYKRLSTGEGHYLAEIRSPVVLFLNFTGLDYDHDEAAREKLNDYVCWVQNILKPYQGYILQITIGDKGSYFYTTFGAPIAHEDDPIRAVAAALVLRSPPPEFDFIRNVQIGLNQGRMRTGAYGGLTRRTYGVLGDEVNIAARLMGKAKSGEILVSQRVAKATEAYYNSEDQGLIKVKGKDKPVSVSLILGPHVAGHHKLITQYGKPLVGRQVELTQMMQILGLTRTGQSSILRIQGESGIGKSHLTSEFVAQASASGVRVAVGIGRSTTRSIPYYPWRQIWRTLLDLSNEATTGENQETFENRQIKQVEAILAQMNPTWVSRLPLLNTLLGLPIPDNPTTAAFDPKVRQQALFALILDMTQAWAKHNTLLLVLEDVHWIDEISLELALSLSRALTKGGSTNASPVLLTLVHRPPMGGDPPLLFELDELPHYYHIRLSPLSPASVETMVINHLKGRPTPLTQAVVQTWSQGHPFFLEELIDSLRETEGIYKHDNGTWYLADHIFERLQQAKYLVKDAQGQWQLTPNVLLSTFELDMPDSIQGIVLARLDRLTETDRVTLKVASVIGRTFEFDLLVLAHPLRRQKGMLLSQMSLLNQRNFIYPEAAPPHLAYAFEHNIIQEVVYETMLGQQQQELHKAVAEKLEMYHPSATEALAYHAFRGQDWPRALRYQLLMGEQAQSLFANHEAIDHYKKTLQAADNLPPDETLAQRQQITLALGELLITTGKYDEATKHLDKAMTLATERGDPDSLALACRWMGRMYEMRGEFESAFKWIEKGIAAIPEQKTPEMAELLLIAGLINSRQGEYDEALSQCETCLDIGKRLNEVTVLGRTYNLLGHISRLQGLNVKAVEHFEKALHLYKQAGHLQGQALSHNQIANAYFYMGQWSTARPHYEQALEMFRQIGDVYNQAFVANNLGGIELNQGLLNEAQASYETALTSLERIGGSLWVLGVIHNNLGDTFTRKKDIETARHHLQISQANFEQAQARDFLPEMHRHFAEAALAANELNEAETQAQQALSLSKELGMRQEEGNSLRLLGQVALEQNHLEQAEQYLSQSVSLLDESSNDYEGARSRLALGRVYVKQQKSEAATPVLKECIAVFERLGAAIDLKAAQSLQIKIKP